MVANYIINPVDKTPPGQSVRQSVSQSVGKKDRQSLTQTVPTPPPQPVNLPRPCFDECDSCQVFGAKQMPQVIGLCLLFVFSFCLHGLYRSFRVLVPILPRHFPQDFFRFFDSTSSRKPTRRLGNEPRKKETKTKTCKKQQEKQKLIEFSSVIQEQHTTTFSSRRNADWSFKAGCLLQNSCLEARS